ncbi:hypothetical protein IW146_000403 [Coemansia sp. RSA 922]|nr:hypothetical protein LPJ71_001296 [Coemansia sp. S17]KAJ2030759.1 hypothetical protein H4S03_006914 [Coemansia sp. S3946]KAJ2042978.1 hypothetical protein H4S04_007013 [Coemansia sp. S16]KAJ2064029.1 hypothetical protein GGH13_006216 [Coemansia sp. S155-1]KAJ2097321.1 hypothetical protein GGI09_003896 [Coemansia sp. S100]KAJ2117880.1 hypothetical protein IW146_000403 [Coemansia sp. RSA 922]KAJ2420590.1 hypothetical protein GGF41_004200 [Coemansia sp. RSA 2531]
MDAGEIELYVTKLAEVELALSADPDNSELQTLKSEIEDLLLLSSQLHEPSTSSTAESADTKRPQQQQKEWQIGDECEAKYAGDGKFYVARVTSTESASSGVYQVSFIGYEKGSLQTTRALDMREKSRKTSNSSNRLAVTKDGKITKKRQGAKDRDGGSAVATSQQAWLKFAKGGGSKKLKAKAINDQSIFKSPDTVSGKVGVTNSGKGMAKNPSKTKF